MAFNVEPLRSALVKIDRLGDKADDLLQFTMPEYAALIGSVAEIERLSAILDTPLYEPFAEAVVAEAKHQVFRWGALHDERKDAFDWVWLLGHLATKAGCAAKAGDTAKALHHTLTAAAVLANWHRHLAAAKAAA